MNGKKVVIEVGNRARHNDDDEHNHTGGFTFYNNKFIWIKVTVNANYALFSLKEANQTFWQIWF